ncbi:hypothetical protein V7S43_001958 [Phytophthora oleae]|uniref:Renin receptor-like C-terminal transmembrane spanning segment domain-containing protein n=1 Tax=Phytophthora oleae TaxID=2107226 RepID=A0ABD3G0H8_9STRA
MADLALSSLGLSTGRVSSRSAVQSPLQADIFTHSEAYALLLVDDASSASLESVNAALNGAQAFHEVYPAQTANVKIPVAVAQEFGAKYASGLHCAGSAALCASVRAETPSVTAELVQQVLTANSFLSSSDEQDVAFAKELAQVMQLTAELKQTRGKRLYLVGLSSLAGNKQKAAQQAVTTTVTEFLAQLMKNEQVVGSQIMTGTLSTAVQQTAALSRRARNRKLVTKLTNEEEEEEEEEESEDSSESESESEEEDGSDELEVVDLAAASGSAWEDDNSASTTNTTAPGALSMPDIAEFQIILWTSVLLGAVLLMAVLAMANMDAGRDSLLYAKFIADVNGRKTN